VTNLLESVQRLSENTGQAASVSGILLRVTALLLAAMLIAVGLRRSSAALRNLVWTLALVGALLVPLFSYAFSRLAMGHSATATTDCVAGGSRNERIAAGSAAGSTASIRAT